MTNQQCVLAFDGQDDYVNINHSNSLNVNAVTLELWFEWGKQGSTVDFLLGKAYEELEIHLGGGGGNQGIRFIPTGGVYLDTGDNKFKSQQWVHVAAVYDPSQSLGKVYINGEDTQAVSHGSKSLNTAITKSTSNFFLGVRNLNMNPPYHFQGKMAEVRVWNKVRTQAEIQQDMKRRLTGTEPGLVAYLPMSECSGSTASDKTANGNHGTIHGATWVQEELPIQPTPLNLVTNSKIKLKSWKGDYLHRPDTAQGVDTGGTGAVSEWIVESIGDNKIKLKSSKGDYLHRPDTVQGVTTWGTGIGNEWIVELIGDKKIKLKSWKGDYLHRPDTAQGVTTWGTGIGNEWMVEFISTEKPPTSQTLEDGLIAHYLFDSNAQDTSGHNLHGTVHGATLTTDRFGIPESAYQFDGVDDYIEVPHNDLLNLTDNLTISLWLKQEAGKAAGYRLVEKGSYGVNDGYNFDTYDGSTGRKLRLCGGVQNAQANTVYSLNEWHHVAVVFSKGVSTFYLDGKPDGSAPHGSPSIRTNSLSLLIGSARGSKAEFFKGALDDIRIYNRALSEQQIKAIHQLPSSKSQVKTGKIVINGDEWTFTNDGIKVAPDAAVFATNIAKWFAGDRPGKFHAYSTNFGLTQSALAEAMQKAGHTWTTGTNIKFDLPTLLTYDGIFVGGDAADNQVLIEYVKAGGNVYVMAGTGSGGAQAEADHWNPFLNAFGFKLLGEYNDVRGNQPINYSHPILAGVKELFQHSTNPIVNLDATSGKNQLILTRSNGQGLIATFDGTAKKPQPGTKTGKIVINADEWTLSNDGIKVAPDAAIFVTNIAKWFTGGRTGKFHAYSTNFGLTQSTLAETMQKAGHTWTTGINISWDIATLLTYDGIFVGGDVADNQVLIEYVKAGGNVYIMAGTGWGGAQGEANHWNAFLNAFGFNLVGEYNGINGNQTVNYSHPILTGVKELFQNHGNSIVNLDPASSKNQLVLTHSSGQGLIATFEGTPGTAVTLGGNTVDDKAYADSRSKFYLVDTNNPINGVGEVTKWEIWAENPLPVQLIIYRKGANSWSVVGQSEVKTPVVGFNDFSLSAPIKVEKGDFVGAYYPQQGSVSFSKPDNEAWDLGNLNGKVLFTGSGAASTAFSGSSNRIYSIRVKGNLA